MLVGAKTFVEVIIRLGVVEGRDTRNHDKEDDGCSEEIDSGSIVLDTEVDFRSHVGFSSEVGFEFS